MKLFILLLVFSSVVNAHSGRTNSEGCHNDNVGGTGFHCHTTKGPAPAPAPISFPIISQNSSVIRGDISQIPSVYTTNAANLQCVNTEQGSFNTDLFLAGDEFCIDTSERVEQCPSYSGKYSFLTNILTIFDIDVESVNYKVSLELNNSGCFDLFYVQNIEEGSPQAAIEYNRDDWGDWLDVDGDCQDTRDEVLATFNNGSSNPCDVISGVWLYPYTATQFTNSSGLDIDHIVPLSYAHERSELIGHQNSKQDFTTTKKIYCQFHLPPIEARAINHQLNGCLTIQLITVHM